jgi:hypothetical protein
MMVTATRVAPQAQQQVWGQRDAGHNVDTAGASVPLVAADAAIVPSERVFCSAAVLCFSRASSKRR